MRATGQVEDLDLGTERNGDPVPARVKTQTLDRSTGGEVAQLPGRPDVEQANRRLIGSPRRKDATVRD